MDANGGRSDGPLLIGVREWARHAGLGRDATYRQIREGKIRVIRIGRRILIPRAELEAYVAREAMAAAP